MRKLPKIRQLIPIIIYLVTDYLFFYMAWEGKKEMFSAGHEIHGLIFFVIRTLGMIALLTLTWALRGIDA